MAVISGTTNLRAVFRESSERVQLVTSHTPALHRMNQLCKRELSAWIQEKVEEFNLRL